jgi:hypothetical protein
VKVGIDDSSMESCVEGIFGLHLVSWGKKVPCMMNDLNISWMQERRELAGTTMSRNTEPWSRKNQAALGEIYETKTFCELMGAFLWWYVCEFRKKLGTSLAREFLQKKALR